MAFYSSLKDHVISRWHHHLLRLTHVWMESPGCFYCRVIVYILTVLLYQEWTFPGLLTHFSIPGYIGTTGLVLCISVLLFSESPT